MNKKISEKIESAVQNVLNICRIRELDTKVEEFINSLEKENIEIESITYIYSQFLAVLFLKRSSKLFNEIEKVEQCKRTTIVPALIITLPGAEIPSNYVILDFNDPRKDMAIEYMQQIDDTIFFVLLSPVST